MWNSVRVKKVNVNNMKKTKFLLLITVILLGVLKAEPITLYSSNSANKVWQIAEEVARAKSKYNPLLDKAPAKDISAIAKIAISHLNVRDGSQVYVISSITLEPIKALCPVKDQEKQPLYWYYRILVKNRDATKLLDDMDESKDLIFVLLDGTVVPASIQKKGSQLPDK